MPLTQEEIERRRDEIGWCFKCPNAECDNEDTFFISCATCAEVYANTGEVDATDITWEDDSSMHCGICHEHGTVKDFEDAFEKAYPA